MRDARRLALIAALTVVGVAAAGCGGDDPSGDPGGDASSIAPATAAIGIVDFAFEPSTLTVAPGSTDITITNNDTADHTFTLDDGSVDEVVGQGSTGTLTVSVTASTGFHCSIHPQMTGTLNVA